MFGLTGHSRRARQAERNALPGPTGIASHVQEVLEAFRDLLSPRRDGELFTWRRGGETCRLTRVEFRQAVVALKDRMIESGYQSGERIAILSESNPEWPLVFIA